MTGPWSIDTEAKHNKSNNSMPRKHKADNKIYCLTKKTRFILNLFSYCYSNIALSAFIIQLIKYR